MRRSFITRSSTVKIHHAVALFEKMASTAPTEFGFTCLKMIDFQASRDIIVHNERLDFMFRVTKPSCNFMGFMHGGMYPVLADAFTTAHIVAVRPESMHVSVELATSYSSKAKLGANIVGRSTILKMGRQLVFTRMDFMDGETVCASVSHTKAFLPQVRETS